MPAPKMRSWTQLVLWAGTTPDLTAAALLPRFSSLEALAAAAMADIEALIETMHAKIGALPVTDFSLTSKADLYLPWLHHILIEYEAAAAAGLDHPRLFALLPQLSNHRAFIAISSSGLHR